MLEDEDDLTRQPVAHVISSGKRSSAARDDDVIETFQRKTEPEIEEQMTAGGPRSQTSRGPFFFNDQLQSQNYVSGHEEAKKPPRADAVGKKQTHTQKASRFKPAVVGTPRCPSSRTSEDYEAEESVHRAVRIQTNSPRATQERLEAARKNSAKKKQETLKDKI